MGPDRRPGDDRRRSGRPPAWPCRPTSRSTSRWSRSRDRARRRAGAGRGRRGAGRAARADRGGPRGAPVRRRAPARPARDRRPRGGRPGDRRRAARRPRGEPGGPRDPPRRVGRPGRAGDRPGGGSPHRALRRRRRDAAVAGRARDPGDRRLPPAGDPGRRRADPGGRLGLHDPGAPPSPADRRARSGGDSRPALPVRHRLRVPRAVRPDQPRRPAAARCRGRRPARRVDRRRAMPVPGSTTTARRDRPGRRRSNRGRVEAAGAPGIAVGPGPG